MARLSDSFSVFSLSLKIIARNKLELNQNKPNTIVILGRCHLQALNNEASIRRLTARSMDNPHDAFSGSHSHRARLQNIALMDPGPVALHYAKMGHAAKPISTV
jgi:hypothetical protein